MATAPASTAQRAPAQGRPHTIRYLNALNGHWRHKITPAPGETAKIGHHAANYLIAIIAWADERFLMDGLHGDGCLCLPNSMQERLTGFSVRQCMRIRQALQRYGLIRVVPGKAGRGGKTSPRITILFEKILDVPRSSSRRQIPEVGQMERSIAPERRDTDERIAPDRPYMDPTDPPVRTDPRSLEEIGPGTRTPETERTNSESESGSEPAAEPIHETPTPNAAPRQPSNPPNIAPEDLELASPFVDLWRESPKCSPTRRHSLREAVRSEGDAQTVRMLASLRREGMPEELLAKAFQACLDGYTPDLDKLHSPYIHSLIWFQPWIENVVDPWRRDRSHRRALQEEARRREAARQEEESTLIPPPLTSFKAFVDRYSGRSFLPPADVLCAELEHFAPDVATHHRDLGSSKREILEETRERCQPQT